MNGPVMLKKLLLLALAFPLVSFAKDLNNYNSVVNAIEHGNNITLYMDFAHCTPKEGFSAYYSPRNAMIFNHTILFSDYHFTLNNPQFFNKATIENISYKLDKNGNLNIKTAFLDPTNDKEIGKQPPIITCQVGKGVHFYSR